MKLLDTDSQTLFREWDRICREKIQLYEMNRSLRTTVSVYYDRSRKDPQIELRTRCRSYSLKDILGSIVLYHYLDEDLKPFVKLELEQVITKYTPLEDRDQFLDFLETLGYIKCYLLESSRFFKNECELFGWLCALDRNLKIQVWKQPDFKWLNNPVNRSRHRGYRDKGSLGSSFIGRKEWIRDWSNLKEEEEREEYLKLCKDTAEIVRGFTE